MAYTAFNGASVTFTKSDSTVIFTDAPMTSISLMGGARAEVDVSTSSGRISFAGHRSPRKLNVGMILDDPTVAELEGAMVDDCVGTLLVKTTTCAGVSADFVNESAWIMNYDVSGQIDGALEVTIDFLVDETPA